LECTKSARTYPEVRRYIQRVIDGIDIETSLALATPSPKPDTAQASITIPKPPKDQVEYLETIIAAHTAYDPETVIGGPKPLRMDLTAEQCEALDKYEPFMNAAAPSPKPEDALRKVQEASAFLISKGYKDAAAISSVAVIDLLWEFRVGAEDALREALRIARDQMLFMHEMCGYVPENIRFAIHKIDAALGNALTELKCTSDSTALAQERT
jgi:hypothetical protein